VHQLGGDVNVLALGTRLAAVVGKRAADLALVLVPNGRVSRNQDG
jgi:hypothetical protein